VAGRRGGDRRVSPAPRASITHRDSHGPKVTFGIRLRRLAAAKLHGEGAPHWPTLLGLPHVATLCISDRLTGDTLVRLLAPGGFSGRPKVRSVGASTGVRGERFVDVPQDFTIAFTNDPLYVAIGLVVPEDCLLRPGPVRPALVGPHELLLRDIAGVAAGQLCLEAAAKRRNVLGRGAIERAND